MQKFTYPTTVTDRQNSEKKVEKLKIQIGGLTKKSENT